MRRERCFASLCMTVRDFVILSGLFCEESFFVFLIRRERYFASLCMTVRGFVILSGLFGELTFICEVGGLLVNIGDKTNGGMGFGVLLF